MRGTENPEMLARYQLLPQKKISYKMLGLSLLLVVGAILYFGIKYVDKNTYIDDYGRRIPKGKHHNIK